MRNELSNRKTLLRVEDLKKHFPIRRGIFKKIVGHVKAIDGINFTMEEGETVGLVGESGSGKELVAAAIHNLGPSKA